MIPAYAASLLKESGYNVVWDDAIAEKKAYDEWLKGVEKAQPDVMMVETKTPVVKQHWKIVKDIKSISPETKIVLVGDHVTALPEESMKNSETDYVLTGVDYDFLLLNLLEYLNGKSKVLEPGTWYKTNGKVKTTGKFLLDHNPNVLPFIDRDLTKWRLYAYKNGNFKVSPGTYTMVGRDCWWRKNGGCTFCSWPTLYPVFRARSPELLINEIGMLVERYGFKEVFDDTGTFPVGNWLRKFCKLMVEYGYNEKVSFSCNMRFGALTFEEYMLMKKAGFRMLIFGLESANQKTLDRLNKGISVQDIIDGCRMAKEAGLEPHITTMVGYPWETREEVLVTLKLVRMLMEKGWAVTLQSTIVMPYPGTEMYNEALKNGWFRINPDDYEHFDMTKPVLNTQDMNSEEVVRICDEIYKVFLSPKYALRQFARIRSWRDLRYSVKGAVKVLGHVKDFARSE
jgi:radical SAM superfamily enzyme YgiQ (UPF0313 family)